MFAMSFVDSFRRCRPLVWLPVAVLIGAAAASPTHAQLIKLPPVKLPPVKVPDLEQLEKDASKELGKLDPTTALRRDLDNARKAAMKDLRKLDPQEVFRRVQSAVQTRISGELRKSGVKYDSRSGEADLRGTQMGKSLANWLHDFSQGNKRASGVEELSFNVKTRKLVVRLYVRHCQSWGKIIPGQGAVDLYSVTQQATFRYNFRSGSGDFDIDLGPLAPRIDSRTAQKLQEGDLVGVAEGLVPEAIGKQLHHEEKNEYANRLSQYRTRYGTANVYFASEKFVKWATPETIGKYIVNGVVSGGASVYPQIMRDLEKRAREELPALTDWLKRRGMANADSAARQLLTGHTPRWPFLKFEMLPVRYSAREKPLNAVTTPWRSVNHLAFAIVWTEEGQKKNPQKAPPIPPGETKKTPVKTIEIHVANQTAQSVAFHLNGGKEGSVVLQPKQQKSFRILLGNVKGPSVSFMSRKGQSSSLPVRDGGTYTFRMVGGEVRLIGR